VKQVGKAPNVISEEVAKRLAENTEIFVSTSATGGYVNFFLMDNVWIDLFSNLEQNPPNPLSQGGTKPTVIVDYIGANAGKPLHIGHICTPSIGQVVCNIYRHLGHRVIGDSHFGDWGGIFGKLIYGWKNEEYWKYMISKKNEKFFQKIELFNTFQPWAGLSDQKKNTLKYLLLEEI
jgi:arginyl-tRNA synthetase